MHFEGRERNRKRLEEQRIDSEENVVSFQETGDFEEGVRGRTHKFEGGGRHLVNSNFVTSSNLISYSGPLLEAIVKFDGREVRALIDTGSQVNLISDSLRLKIGAEARTDGNHEVRGAGGAAIDSIGKAEGIGFMIGGLSLHGHFYCASLPSDDVILGAPFLHSTQATIQYEDAGTSTLDMRYEDRSASLILDSKSI